MTQQGEIIEGPWPETEVDVTSPEYHNGHSDGYLEGHRVGYQEGEDNGAEQATEDLDDDCRRLVELMEEWFESGTFQAIPCDRYEFMRRVAEYEWL